jgi:hypothetical protein
VPINHDYGRPAFIKPFDPVKAAKREFGLLVELTELMRMQDLPWIPITVERYIYVSHSLSRAFRMRTYFFHFGKATAANAEQAFAHAWIDSKLYFANGEAFHEVEPIPGGTAVPPSPTKGDIAMATSKLFELVTLLGGLYEAEYKQLISDSRTLHQFRTALGVKAPVEPESTSAVAALPTVPAILVVPEAKPKKRAWHDLSPQEQIEFAIRALEFKRDHPAEHTNGGWKDLLKGAFGHYTKSLGTSCRSVMARTSGKFRPGFIARVKKAFGPSEAKAYLDRLAKC